MSHHPPDGAPPPNDETIFVLVASDGADEKADPPSLRVSAIKPPLQVSLEPTKWSYCYNRQGWESSVVVQLHLNSRFHEKEFTKTNITKQPKSEHLKYRVDVHRFEMKGSDIVNGPWRQLDPTSGAQASSVWSVDYLIFRREQKGSDAHTADCGRAVAVDDVCRLRDFLVAATAYAQYRVGLLHKAALDAPMHSDLLRSLRELMVTCKEKLPPHLLEFAVTEHLPNMGARLLCNSGALPGPPNILATQVRHAKFFQKIGRSTWILIMKHFIKWKVEEELSVDSAGDKKNKMWVTRPPKSTDPIAAADIVITKLKEGEAFVPWQVWLGDTREKTAALRANVSVQ